MSIPGVDGLIEDLKVTFAVPAAGLIIALMNIRFTPRSKFNGLKLRLFLVFVLLLFATSLSVLMFQDRAVLKALWQSNPTLYSVVYLLSTVVVVIGVSALAYWKLRPAVWTWKDRE